MCIMVWYHGSLSLKTIWVLDTINLLILNYDKFRKNRTPNGKRKTILLEILFDSIAKFKTPNSLKFSFLKISPDSNSKNSYNSTIQNPNWSFKARVSKLHSNWNFQTLVPKFMSHWSFTFKSWWISFQRRSCHLILKYPKLI